MANRRFNLWKNLSLSWNKTRLRIFFFFTALPFTANPTIKMFSFQRKRPGSWYLLTCSHCWLFVAQLSDLSDKFAPWLRSVWCGKSNIWRLIGGSSLSDMLLHITFNINWMFPPLSVCSDPVRTAFSKRRIDKPSNWHGWSGRIFNCYPPFKGLAAHTIGSIISLFKHSPKSQGLRRSICRAHTHSSVEHPCANNLRLSDICFPNDSHSEPI